MNNDLISCSQASSNNTQPVVSNISTPKGRADKLLKVIDALRGASQGGFFGYAAINSTYKTEGHGLDVHEAALSVGSLELVLCFISLCVLAQNLAFRRYPCSLSNFIKIMLLVLSMLAAIGLLASTVYDQFGERPTITIAPEKISVVLLSFNLAVYRAISEVFPLGPRIYNNSINGDEGQLPANYNEKFSFKQCFSKLSFWKGEEEHGLLAQTPRYS